MGYVEVYEKFWASIVENHDGSLNRDAVMRELHDYYNMLEEVTKVFCHITNGRISKPNTLASAVIPVADDCIEETIRNILAEHAEEILDMLSPEDKHAEYIIRKLLLDE